MALIQPAEVHRTEYGAITTILCQEIWKFGDSAEISVRLKQCQRCNWPGWRMINRHSYGNKGDCFVVQWSSISTEGTARQQHMVQLALRDEQNIYEGRLQVRHRAVLRHLAKISDNELSTSKGNIPQIIILSCPTK